MKNIYTCTEERLSVVHIKSVTNQESDRIGVNQPLGCNDIDRTSSVKNLASSQHLST
jgi:hypothetical protein